MGPSHGLADAGRTAIRPRVLAAWDAFLAHVDDADLALPSGAPGRRGHDLCVPLGLWTEHATVHDLVTSARSGGHDSLPDVRTVRDEVLASHEAASRAEIVAALRRHRDAVAIYFSNHDESLDLAPTASSFGRIPLLSVFVGEAYSLAVTALDLVPCGAPPPPGPLLDAGLAGLAEVTGALAVDAELAGSVAFRTPEGGWAVTADENGWTVSELGHRQPGGTVVEGTAADLLAAGAGRADARKLLATRRLRVQQASGLLRFAPLADLPWTPGAGLFRL